jgi:uncharacterized protein DUF1996
MFGLLIGLLLVGITATPSDAGPNQRGPIIKFQCSVAKVAAIDPILDPQHPHDHVFYGNKGVNADSTADSLAANKMTTCARGFATSSWWHPQVKDNGELLKSDGLFVYYRGLGDQTKVVDIPRGLQLIGNESSGDVTYRCGDKVGLQEVPYGCKSGLFGIIIHFPDCWNGGGLEPSNTVYQGEEPCPSTHPYQLPDSRILILFRNADRNLEGPLTVSAGDGYYAPISSMHADVFEANQEPAFSEKITRCIRKVGDNQRTPKGCAT